MNETISEKLVDLRIATRRACMCERVSDKKKNTLSLESKILFLIKDKPLTPIAVMNELQIQKTNLAALSKRMEKKGLLEKVKLGGGKREIVYEITQLGKEQLNCKLDIIEKAFKKFLTSDEEYLKALDTVDAALNLLSFLAD